MKTRINAKVTRIFALFLALVMVCSSIVVAPKTVSAVTNTDSSVANSYGLMEDVQDGVILQCWDWSFNNIKSQLADIAAAGYTAIQTSPIQEAKEPTKGVSNEKWWLFYQPKSFVIDDSGESGLGTKAEFEAMCDEAHKYGIKVIVDVVANHLGNNLGYDKASSISSDIRDDEACWHSTWNVNINYDNRYSITHGSMAGLPDLNTENEKIQNYVLNFLKECIDSGADGFRFDAAKHISVLDEGTEYTFWDNTLEKAKEYATSTRGIELYAYGEILDKTNGPDIESYTKYMSVTDNETSNSIRNCVVNGMALGAASPFYIKQADADKSVLWAESHDTYSNEDMQSTNVSVTDINKTWALVASRADATALYYARTAGYRAGIIGEIGTYDWKNPEVVAVNKFHNYFNGQTEYLASEGDIAYNERGTTGAVLVNCAGTSATVSIKANRIVDGTYIDDITGNVFTVSDGVISGQIGNTGIAVLYANKVEPMPTISKAGGNFATETLTLTVGLKNAVSGTYKIDDAKAITYTSATTINIGSDVAIGDSVTVTLTATDGTNTSTKTYVFTKVAGASNIAYISLPTGWNTPVYCYAYDEDTAVENAEWPGIPMTYDSESGYYKYEIPEEIETPRVIFYSSNEDRYPADGVEGLLCNGKYVYKNDTWTEYTGPIVFDAPYENAVYFENTANWSNVNVYFFNESTVGKEWPGAAMTDLGDGIFAYELAADFDATGIVFNNGSGEQTDDFEFTMNGLYNASKYLKVVEKSSKAKVTSSLPSGSSFNGETEYIKLTLSNAVSGTYSVDDGLVRQFTDSAIVEIGKGKIADSTVTVVATARSASGEENTYTFTYEKIFNGTVNELIVPTTDDEQVAPCLTPPSVELNFGANKSAPQWVCEPLELIGIAKSGVAPYTYEFYVNGELMATETSESEASVLWQPSNIGEYIIECRVTDASGASVTSSKYYEIGMGRGCITPLEVEITADETEVLVGTEITLEAVSTDGMAPYLYTFYIYDDEISWYEELVENSMESTCKWLATKEGSYRFMVKITDAFGDEGKSQDIVIKVTEKPALNGLHEDSEGNLCYYVNGVVDTTVTCLIKYNGDWVYVVKGMVDYTYTGLVKNSYGWWYVKNGKIDFTYTGMAKNKYGWWYVKYGKLDFTYTGMAKNKYGWWYMKNGKLDLTYTGMAKNKYGWWYMKDGKLDLTYTGMAKNKYGWWYMKDGRLDLTYTGMAKNKYGWWYMQDGRLDLTYTGISTNAYGWWYVKNGKLDTTYTGKATYNGETYDVKNGLVVK